jgi:hypothetical protein
MPRSGLSLPKTICLSFMLLFGLAAGVVARLEPAASRSEQSGAAFSVARAIHNLEILVGDGAPHPLGSAADSLIQARLIRLLREGGYEASLDSSFECDDSGDCAEVRNVVATLPGSDTQHLVLLTAHYDSVGAGPGASDDAASAAAIIEIASLLRRTPHLNGIVFLLDGGEEAGVSGSTHPGLRGARHFLATSPLAKRIACVVNLEARGTSGASLMFETSGDNAWLVRLMAHALRRPVTNSVLSTIYGALPNATDLTLYKRAGIPGVNFAFIGDAARYHTALDSFENVNRGSLQHQGDNAFELLRTLADTNLTRTATGNAVFFDVFAATIVSWPESWSVSLAISTLVLVSALGFVLLRRRLLRVRELAFALLTWTSALALSTLSAWGLVRAVRAADGLSADWLAFPVPVLAALTVIAISSCLTVCTLMTRKTCPLAMWLTTWLVWSSLGCIVAVSMPGLSYPFLVPCLAATGAIGFCLKNPTTKLSIVICVSTPACCAVILWTPPLYLANQAMGANGLALYTVLVTNLAATLAPLLVGLTVPRRWTFPAIWSASLVLAFVVLLALPSFTRDSPGELTTVLYRDSDDNSWRWLVSTDGVLPSRPEGVTEGPAFPWGSRPAFPWWTESVSIAPAAVELPLQPPELTVLDRARDAEGRTHLRALLRSPRGATTVSIHFPPTARIDSLTMEGVLVPSLDPAVVSRQNGWRIFTSETLPAAGLELNVVLSPAGPTKVVVVDRTLGIPATFGDYTQTAVPRHEGNALLVARRFEL